MKHAIRGILLGGFLLAISFMFTAGEALAAQPLLALNAKLKGTYVWTRFRTCVQTDGDFEKNAMYPQDNLVIINTYDPANTRSNVIRSEVTFNGDGTGSTETDGTSIRLQTRLNFGNQPVIRFGSSCTFGYTVDPDNSFEMIFSTCTSQSVEGPGAGGGSSTLTGVIIRGQMANGGQTLIVADNDANVETLTTGGGATFKRICIRSGTAVKVNN